MRNLFVEKLQNFHHLTPKATIALTVATARVRAVPARQDLIREGHRPGPVFVMLDGWACRYKILPDGTRQILAFLLPGDCCDLHIGLLAEMDHSIQTITPPASRRSGERIWMSSWIATPASRRRCISRS